MGHLWGGVEYAGCGCVLLLYVSAAAMWRITAAES